MTSRLRSRAIACAAALATVSASALVLAPRGAAAAASHSALTRVGTVHMSSLHGAASHPQPSSLPGHRVQHSGAQARTRSSARSGGAAAIRQVQMPSAGGTSTGSTATVSPRTLAGPTTVEQLQDFGGISHNEQVADFGQFEQDVTPPDTQVATGPVGVMEATNSAYLLMGRHGENRQAVDQYGFWINALSAAHTATGTTYYLTDPRTVYDGESGRFFTSILLFNGGLNTDSWIGIAVSDGNDAGGTWTLWIFQSDTNTLDDQPLLGLNSDKEVLSFNQFDTATGHYNDYLGARYLVVEKADLLSAAVSPSTSLSAADLNVESIVPAISETPTTTEYLAWNELDFNVNPPIWEFVDVQALTGTPAHADVTAATPHRFDLTGGTGPIGAPFAAQQQGSDHLLDASDGRLQSLVNRDGVLNLAGAFDDQCTASAPDLSAVIAERVDTSTWAFDDLALCSSSDNVFDPANVIDGNGVAFYSFSRSGAHRYASTDAWAFNWNGSGTPFYAAGGIHSGAGVGPYACNPSCDGSNQTPPVVERWGDYSGIALDPVNSNDVWVAAEYAANSGGNWGTAIGRVTVAAPSVSGLSTGSGRTGGGTSTIVTGNDFDPAGVAALFGGVAAQSVAWMDPEHIAVTTPPHSTGTVPVQVRTADGTGGGGSFTYVEPPLRAGYWLVATDGGIFSYGSAGFHGSTGNIRLNQPIVGMAPRSDGQGYWLVASDGGVFAENAPFLGSTGNIHLNQPIVGMAATPDGQGYWMVARDGGIFSFGTARFFGSTGAIHLNQPIVGMAPTPTGKGYWLVASDGGIFSFGDAAFHGSAGAIHLNKPIAGMTATSDGGGYWLVATDGGIFTYGDAAFKGSAGNIALNKPIVGMTQSGDDGGYWLVATDGGIFSYGDAAFKGSAGNIRLNQPIAGMASVPA